MSSYLEVIIFALIGGVASLSGGLILLSNKKLADGLSEIAAPFAAGALLAAAFFELIPEALHDGNNESISLWILTGIVGFFAFEFLFHWFHHHHEHEGSKNASPPLIIAGDTLHNLIDGIAIGAAFTINPATGIATALAVAAHEIPQEIGDFGLLLKAGYSRKKIIIANIVSAMAALVGAVVTFNIGSDQDLPVSILLAITAGAFIYIAASDLLPGLHDKANTKAGYLAATIFVAGILTVGAATTLAHELSDTHNHGSDSSSHTDDDHEGEDHHEDEHRDDEENHSENDKDNHDEGDHGDDDHKDEEHDDYHGEGDHDH